MSKTGERIIIFIGFSILFGAAYLAYEIWRSMEDGGYLSCLSSIAGEIEMLDRTKSLTEQSNEWKILNEEEVDVLMSQIRGYDCGKYQNQTLDSWGRKINIALRKPSNRIEIFVWSNGRDGVSGTKDDLVIPYGQPAPKSSAAQ